MGDMSGSATRANKSDKQYRSRRKLSTQSYIKSPELLQAAIIVIILVIAATVIRNIRLRNNNVADELPSFVKEDYIALNRYTRPGILNPGIRKVVFVSSGTAGQTAASVREGFLKAGTDGQYGGSHFAVGYDGSVLCCIPLEEIAYGCFAGSSEAISVTYSSDFGEPPSGKEYESIVELGRWIKERFGLAADDFVSAEEIILIASGLESDEEAGSWNRLRAEVGR